MARFQPDDEDPVVELLSSIDATLKAMLKLAQQRTAKAIAAQPKAVASDKDMDDKYGDPVVKFLPRDWTGEDFKNAHFSECPAGLLDMLAKSFDYFGLKNAESGKADDKGRPVARYDFQRAALARGWAKRIRDGKVQQQAETAEPEPLGGDAFEWPSADEVFK